jgi:hypothetical protein
MYPDGMTKTFQIRGVRVRTASARRFIVVAYRATDVTGDRWDYRVQDLVPEVYRAFPPTIIRRSDNYETARKARDKYGQPKGGWCVVVDSVTGEEV